MCRRCMRACVCAGVEARGVIPWVLWDASCGTNACCCSRRRRLVPPCAAAGGTTPGQVTATAGVVGGTTGGTEELVPCTL
jgi:hypothetical protein